MPSQSRRALALVPSYRPPAKPEFRLPGESGYTALVNAVGECRAKRLATEYDEVVAERPAHVLTGNGADLVDTVTEEQLLALARKAFVESVRYPRTPTCIEHRLETGKLLRN
jgi:3-hydroxyacyl-CoA dehydrogenase